MIFRVINNSLYEVDLDIPNEETFVNTQSTDNTKYILADETKLPENPYEGIAKPYYKLDENNNIVLDLDRMLSEYKREIIDIINKNRDELIEAGFTWTKDNTEYTFGLEESDKIGLMGLSISVLIGQTENLFFITRDNITVPLTPEEAKDLALIAFETAAGIYYKARQAKDGILAATTFEECFDILAQFT